MPQMIVNVNCVNPSHRTATVAKWHCRGLKARVDYDSFGQQTTIEENLKTTFGFTGHFVHAPSGL